MTGVQTCALPILIACKFAPMQTNNLALEKENAIDFINYYIKQAGEGWVFEEKDDMSFFKMTPKPFELVADIDFCLNSTDSFEVELYGKVGDEIIPFDEVYNLTLEGNKYVRIKNLGFAEVPTMNVYSLMRAFNTFDVYRNEENK